MLSKTKQNRAKKARKRGDPRVIETPGSMRFGRSGIPDSCQVTLRYSDYVNVAPGATQGQYTFRGNSLFDPDYTSTGHQPMYYDTYSSLYSKYKVLSSVIRVTASNRSATDPLMVVVIPHSEVLTLTSYPLAAEAPYAVKTKQVSIACRVTEVLMQSMRTGTILGLKGGQLNDEDYSASVGANPNSIWYWNIGVFNAGVGNVSASLQIDLQYTAIFYDRQISGLSYLAGPEKDHQKLPRAHFTGEADSAYNLVSIVSPPVNTKGHSQK